MIYFTSWTVMEREGFRMNVEAGYAQGAHFGPVSHSRAHFPYRSLWCQWQRESKRQVGRK